MPITLADIGRWDPGAVREVSTALSKRGASAEEVRTGLGKLPLIATWQGTGGDAARAALDKLSKHLAAHTEQMTAVADATRKAADEIESVKQAQQRIFDDARREGFDVDPATGAVKPLYPDRGNDPVYAMEQMDLEKRITQVLADANTADTDLARGITMAGDDASGPAEDRPDVRAALSQPLPEDPKQFNDLWNKLTPEEKDWLYSRDHGLGNHPGMPFDPADHLGKDHYNRRHLDELLPRQQAKVDQMQHQFDDLARKAYMGDHNAATALSNLAPQLQAAKHQLDGYKQVHDTVDPPKTIDGKPNRDAQIPRYLGMLDEQGHAAVAVGGNPDTATRNATFVPGTGQDLARLEYSNEKAIAMYGAALDADSSLKTGDVSVTTWMGYDRPMDVPQAASTSPAFNGASGLDAYENGMRASHVGPPSVDTVIGHSYGSTLVGAAASDGHHLAVDNVIAVGSPGMLVPHAGDLNLDKGADVYAMQARNDIISLASGWTLGPDPIDGDFGATRLYADAGPSSDPLGLTPSIDAHSSYWNAGNPALANMGAVIAGVTPPAMPGGPGSS
ncbi:hypothetical protein H7K45_02090 [Mycobacterium yunnanensis]|uniref:DUF1023 domain-containing protein n=1 Tax=Mycobacterium yunnanensis TaxID=368477 RepID=A0A9X2YUT1_9MYCO|nr:alpha/beta hydrolase [Mycobacterium yunnanensis]MCV7419320.1 hypothetical protein [Mycobacterium yunnanensis]